MSAPATDASMPAASVTNVAALIDDHPHGAAALIIRNRTTTYGELRAMVDAARGGLASLGVEPGDRVALLCANGSPFVVTYLAVLGLGAVAVPLNPTSPAPELDHELELVQPKAVVVDAVSRDAWLEVDHAQLTELAAVVRADLDAEALAAAVESGTGTALGVTVVTFDSLLAAEPAPRVEVEPDALAVLAFTSGTAGAPRAAMLTHRNLLASLLAGESSSDPVRSDDLVYAVLPLFHIMGLNVVLGSALRAGAALLLVQRFDPLTAAESIAERKVTIVPGAPAMWTAFAHFPELPADTFASVRLAMSGAARLSPAAFEAMRDRFGVTVYESYGLTEAAPAVTSGVGDVVRPGSVGYVLDGVEVRLVNVNGDALVGDVGEIHVRGENVFPGYYRDEDATAAVFTDDGWLKTGDLGTVDDDGFLYIVDRSKDLIIVSGFNVFPDEVEEAIRSHPAVLEVGVVGVPHPHTGEAVKAFVVLAPGRDVDEDSLIEHTRDLLARYKCPSKVMFVDELPRTGTGKLMRRRLEVPTGVG